MIFDASAVVYFDMIRNTTIPTWKQMLANVPTALATAAGMMVSQYRRSVAPVNGIGAHGHDPLCRAGRAPGCRAMTEEKRRAKITLQRQARHNAAMAEFEARQNHPLTRKIASAICRSVYGARTCACEKRPDMPICSSMAGAALSAMYHVSAHDGPLPLRSTAPREAAR